jgi:hypothetical protein
VRNNPINHNDPSGHCIEGNDDFEECMDWAKRIDKTWDQVHVTVCIGGDVVAGCKGWTAEEMRLLYQTLRDFLLDDLIKNGHVTLIRSNPRNDEENGYGGLTTSWGNDSSEVRIYDHAWTTAPSMGIQDTFNLFRSANNFKGTIAHELTHVAQNFNPGSLDAFVQAKDNATKNIIGQIAFNLSVGVYYDWSVYDQYKDRPNIYKRLVQAEYMAMTVSGLSYDAWFGVYK